jgi:two-component system, OmpR family, response regulator
MAPERLDRGTAEQAAVGRYSVAVTAPRIVILEDDAELQALLERGLAEEGFAAEAVSTGAELLCLVEELAPDAFIVDIGLPDADGRDVCQALRSRGVHAPVLFLTARESVVERISGFDAGGDDYVTKPFAFAELVARLNSLLRRGGADTAVEAAGLRLDPVTHAVGAGSTAVPVSPTEFRLLARLLARPGEAVRRRDLIRAAWPVGAIVRDNTLDAFIARLRRKLRKLPQAPEIATVHGVGYRIG